MKGLFKCSGLNWTSTFVKNSTTSIELAAISYIQISGTPIPDRPEYQHTAHKWWEEAMNYNYWDGCYLTGLTGAEIMFF